MSKNTPKQSIFTIFLLLLFVQSTLSVDIIGIEFDTSTLTNSHTETNASQKQKFRLDFSNGIPRSVNYIRVDLQKSGDIPTPILHFSSTDNNCESPREQIVKNPNNDTVTMYLKVEEFQDGDLFILVELTSTDKSGYTITFTGLSEIEIQANFVYSYLVGSHNKEMVFVASMSENLPQIVTIYAVGSKTLSLVVDGKSGITKFDNGAAVTFKQENANADSNYRITVKANEGEYITVGVNNVLDAKTEDNLLEPNGNEVSGFLLKDVLEDQCFEMSTLETVYKNKKIYVTGRFYSKFAQVYYRDSSFKEIADSAKNVTDGYYTSAYSTSGKKNSLCVRFIPNAYTSLKNISFTLYVTEPTLVTYQYKFHPPQIMGQIYRRIIPKNSVQFYTSLSPPANKRIIFSLKAKSGFPVMYTGKCNSYPYCNDENENYNAPKKANRMYTFSYADITDNLPLSNEKYVLFVKCVDDDNAGNGVCEFETLFNSLNDVVNVVEDETFGQYVLKGDKGSFNINLEGDSSWRTVNIDIMVLSGDVSFSVKSEKGTLQHKKLFLSNKVYFKVESDENDDIKNVIVDFSATLNSYFTIKWNANRQGDTTQYRDYIVSGFSYLVDLDPTSVVKNKTVNLMNLRYKDNKPFLANFFALNCDFKVTRESQEIKFYDGYAQEVLTTSSTKYNQDYYNYVVEIKDADLSNYNNKMCMLYISGMESSTDTYDSEILISENINQQIIFDEGIDNVKFLYPQPDTSKDLVLKVNVIDAAIYQVSVIAESLEVRNIELSRTQIIYLPRTNYEKACASNNNCAITIKVSLVKKIVDTNPMIEITIRPILNTPTYLQKSQAKKDFVCGERLYYLYTDVGKNEEGEILVDFNRGNGQVFAKVARKDQTNVDEEANWRDIYRMPSADWEDSLPYDSYLKKLIVNTEDTENCIEGCYLLVSIQLLSSSGEYIEDYHFYPFSIITRVTPANRAYTDIPKVVIQTDEYIIGNVDVSEVERIYQFYEIWLPHDSDVVEFDWQTGIAGMYINLGGTRPTTRNADFKLLPHSFDEVLMLSKSEIVNKGKERQVIFPYGYNSIQDVNLVIGIWTNKADSLNTELFSLRVHQPIDDELDIVEVSSYQKVQCTPISIEDYKFRCLFMIVYEGTQKIPHILAHGFSNDDYGTNYMYAKFIDKDMYSQSKTADLRSSIPTAQNCEFSSKSNNVDYIYTENVNLDKYLFVSVVSDSPDDMTFLTSLGDYSGLLLPNPTSEQLISVKETVSLKFDTGADVIVNFVSVGGEADIYWVNDEESTFTLKGSGDRLTITSGTMHQEQNMYNLFVKNKNTASNNDPGFVFYMSYFLRNPQINFDEIPAWKSTELAYKDTDFPIYVYSKIYEIIEDVNVALSFHDVYDNSVEKQFFEKSPFNFNVALVKEYIAYTAKNNPELRPSYDKSITGVYDPAIRTFQAFLSLNDLNNFNVKFDDRPTLYFGVEKSDTNRLTYTKFSMEAAVSILNDGVSAVENTFSYGKLEKSTKRNYYKLKIDQTKKVMRVIVSFNSESLDFIINDNAESTQNMTFTDQKKNYGKVTVLLNIPSNKEYLYIIFIIKDQNLANDRRLNNYCFKYECANYASDFKEYIPFDNKKEIAKTESQIANTNLTNMQLFFSPIVNTGNLSITYVIKIVPNETHVYQESCETIALSESPSSFVSLKNYNLEDGVHIYNVSNNWVYIEVVAEVKEGENVEFVSYEGIKFLRPYIRPDDNSGSNVSTTLFIIIGGFLVVIIIVLVVVFVMFFYKNKALVNQVKHVSFQKTNSSPDPNLLLNKQQNDTVNPS